MILLSSPGGIFGVGTWRMLWAIRSPHDPTNDGTIYALRAQTLPVLSFRSRILGQATKISCSESNLFLAKMDWGTSLSWKEEEVLEGEAGEKG